MIFFIKILVKKPNNHFLILYSLFSLILVTLNGCAVTNTVKQVDHLSTSHEKPKVLLFTPDIKYYLLTAGGVPQPHAEWTEEARKNFSSSFFELASNKGMEIITIPDDRNLTEIEIQYKNLYTAVGSSILSHHVGQYKLPTKKTLFDWTLGPGVNVIGEQYGADYALFSYYRDYQASGGRAAFSILAALMGVGISTGGEVGYASLVDLRSGNIIWFNSVSSGTGELRIKDEAAETLNLLFKDLPSHL